MGLFVWEETVSSISISAFALRLYLKPWAQFLSYNMNILAGK